jgi:Cu2+-containing amine oxidase
MKKHQHFKKYKKFKVINLMQKKKQSLKIWNAENHHVKKKMSGNPIMKAIYLGTNLVRVIF